MKKLILAGVAIALLVAGIVRVELVAQSESKKEGAVRNADLAAKQQAMIDAARGVYDMLVESHDQGTGALLPQERYVWSSHLRSAQAHAADSRQQATKACQEHLQRMQDLRRRVASLGQEGVPGGEAHKQSAAQFYLAEAEVLLLEAKGSEPRSQ